MKIDELFHLLGRPPNGTGWTQPLARALVQVLDSSHGSQNVLWISSSNLIENEAVLRQFSSEYDNSLRTKGLTSDLPFPVLLNLIAQQHSPHKSVLLFTHLALELKMRGEPYALELTKIASGMLRKARPGLALMEFTGRPDSIQSFRDKYGAALLEKDGTQIPHQGFHDLWKSGLQQKIDGLLAEAVVRQRRLGQPTFDPDRYSLDFNPPNDSEQDDRPAQDIGLVPAKRDKQRRISLETQNGLAKASALDRRSKLEILQDPDLTLPHPLVRMVIDAAGQSFDKAIAAADPVQAEWMAAIQMYIATGLREQELPEVRLGTVADDRRCVVDLVHGVMLRPEVRPAGSAQFAADDLRWLPTGGPIIIVLPSKLVTTLTQLVEKHPDPGLGGLLFHRMAKVGETEAINLLPYIRALVPALNVGSKAFRQRLSASISEALGHEASQLVLGDGQGLSVGPAFYGRFSVHNLARAAWSAIASVFGEDPAKPPAMLDSNHHVGSRVAVAPEVIRPGLAILSGISKFSAKQKRQELRQCWQSYMDGAAGAVIYCTGVRPNESLLDILLYDIVPEYSLIIVSDKKVDPAHIRRPAVLGATAIQSLHKYVQWLVHCSRQIQDIEAAKVAIEILANRLPLFSAPGPDGTAVPLDIGRILDIIHPGYADKKNLLRHRLNHELIEQGVDPELRHQQMGWFITPATALASMSPISAVEFSSRLLPNIDGYAKADGYTLAKVRPESFWDGVTSPPIQDWKSVRKEHESEHEQVKQSIRASIAERREEILSNLVPRIEAAFDDLVTDVKLDTVRRQLVVNSENPVNISETVVTALLDRLTGSESDPAVAIVARAELARLLNSAHKKKKISGFIPSYQRMGFNSEPSHFLRGMGIAVRQVHVLREWLLSSKAWEEQSKASNAARALLGILLHSPYRNFDMAGEILQNASQAQRVENQPAYIRVPLSSGRMANHVPLSGPAAMLILQWAKRGAEEDIPSQEEIAKWLAPRVSVLTKQELTWQDVLSALEGIAQTAGRLELTGPERLHMLGEFKLNTVGSTRALGRHQHWPSAPGVVETRSTTSLVAPSPDQIKPPDWRLESGMALKNRVVRFFDNKSKKEIRLPRTGVVLTDGMYGRRQCIERELKQTIDDLGVTGNAGSLVASYALHLLVGGKNKGLELSSIHTMLTRFSTPFVEVMAGKDVIQLAPEEFESAYRAVLLTKRIDGGHHGESNNRARTLQEVQSFHKYLVNYCGATHIDWTDLGAIAGTRNDGVDPGLLWDSEIEDLISQLMCDVSLIERNLGHDPDERHLLNQRVLYAVLQAASGCRPGSIYGLTFGDIWCASDGDWIHVRKRGRYGNAKTFASIGFFRLSGKHWEAARGWVQSWLAEERVRHDPSAIAGLPLFGERANPTRRNPSASIGARIHELCRWTTADPLAHQYWIRKLRIIMRHEETLSAIRPKALHVYRTLSESSHVHILTPLKAYLHDPDAIFRQNLHYEANKTTARDVKAFSGVKLGTIEVAMQRAKIPQSSVLNFTGEMRLATSFKAAGSRFVARPAVEAMVPAPVLRVGDGKLKPADVANYIAAMKLSGLPTEAAVAAGITRAQGEDILRVVDDFERLSGLWLISAEEESKELQVPRQFASTQLLNSLLSSSYIDSDWFKVSESWVRSARAVPLSEGLPVLLESDKTLVAKLLGDEKIEFVIHMRGKIWVFVPLRRRALPSGKASRKESLTMWPALSWALMCIYIFGHLSIERDETIQEK